ncbi:polyphosphate kinase 1 [uncultured Capnocytophaga sp.]|uniref:polyphosphate kinase 1 n=1 Tax=uncultured Capnocytophaga sp. TaxID=159273 RepID=UPI00262DE61B|nr:polyphosphate kinase 1 [uncultured Capnocytophaga sp.]
MNTQPKIPIRNRDLSWLSFNERVLQEASDPRNPLVERMRFVGIFSNNLDEFFRVRYAIARRDFRLLKDEEMIAQAHSLLEQINSQVVQLQQKSLAILERIKEELKGEDIYIIDEREILPEHVDYVREYFINTISPALFTIILNEVEALPNLKDDVAYLAVRMVLASESGKKQKIQYALIELPKTLDRFIVLPKIGNANYIILLDDVIRFCLSSHFYIFPCEDISAYMIKITRNAELDLDTDLNKSFIEKISTSVEGRKRAEPVRFIYDKLIDEEMLRFLKEKMGIQSTDSVIAGGRYHNRRDYMNFPHCERKELMYKPFHPYPIKDLKVEESLFSQIAQRDYLQYTPYHSFSYLIRFLREAALDPKVKSIKITIYRLAKQSQVINSLINAVKNGKKVTVQIELQARFDETANIHYAEQLQREGVNTIFGIRGLKVHSKIGVIEREENGKTYRYGFISTGNFNESSAKIYTDYTLFTAHQEILDEINRVFKFFDTPFQVFQYKNLLVSPHYTKTTFLSLIDREIALAKEGKEAFLKLKMNGLTNEEMIEKLYEASQAGVKIQMIVRGVCGLLPQVQGLSENIEVISIVDRFLEHSRLYVFGNDGNPLYYISSADWMSRNLNNRVEVSCPIYQKDIQQQLWDTFHLAWNDRVKARIIDKDQQNAYRSQQQGQSSQEAIYNYYSNN